MNKESILLLVAAAGLAPIALSYGASPAASLSFLYEIDASSVNVAHIFRAVMGLYFAMLLFWIAGALKEHLRIPALWSLVVFMAGLAAGRALSLMVDGMAHPLLVLFLVLEVGFAVVGYKLLNGLSSK